MNTVPAIAIPHQRHPEIWWQRPADDDTSDGHDLYAILESREEAERHVGCRAHQWARVMSLIDQAWPL